MEKRIEDLNLEDDFLFSRVMSDLPHCTGEAPEHLHQKDRPSGTAENHRFTAGQQGCEA